VFTKYSPITLLFYCRSLCRAMTTKADDRFVSGLATPPKKPGMRFFFFFFKPKIYENVATLAFFTNEERSESRD
jgi:hypothetical protein